MEGCLAVGGEENGKIKVGLNGIGRVDDIDHIKSRWNIGYRKSGRSDWYKKSR